MITYCDIYKCEDCPRYADDCDGDKYLDRYPTMHEYAEGKRINPKLTDIISRADAIKAVASITMSIHLSDVICDKLLALPSADAVQGEWIHDGQNFKGGLDWCHCSECGYKTSTNGLSVYRFCPNCGAKMGGAE